MDKAVLERDAPTLPSLLEPARDVREVGITFGLC